MKQKMTVREKILLGILIALILFCVYYFFFLVPVSEELNYCVNENISEPVSHTGHHAKTSPWKGRQVDSTVNLISQRRKARYRG